MYNSKNSQNTSIQVFLNQREKNNYYNLYFYTMNVIDAIASAAPRKGMNDLHQKIDKYVYEIRMIEIDEYRYGMNRTKVDKKKAYEIINDVPDSECNAVVSFWKGRVADHGLRFHKSSRVEKSKNRAKAFYRRAVDLDIEGMAEAGDQYACRCLGKMYLWGWGVCSNEIVAVEWCRKAAEQGYADAQFLLGEMYYYGRGVDVNYSTRVKWFLKAGEQGHADAQIQLGHMYSDGHGVDQNDSTAGKWYRKAAEQGHSGAKFNLGHMYKNGWGADQNDSTAFDWYRKVAEQESAFDAAVAQLHFGKMYEN